MHLLTLIKREIFGGGRFTFLFILNLCIGLFGFSLLDAFKRDFSHLLKSASKTMMAADFAVSSRRAFTEPELSKVRAKLEGHKEVAKKSLYSMVSSESNQSLSEIVAIEPGYPMYGYIQLKGRGDIKADSPHFSGPLKAWVEESLSIQLGIKVGDTIKLGHAKLTIEDIIVDESSVKWQGASLAPRIYVSFETLKAAKLIQKGSIVWHAHLFKLDTKKQDLAKLEALLNKELDDPQIRVRSHLTSGQNSGKMLQYLSDYLSLVALTALALAGLGSSYLFRSYLSSRRKSIAILISVGVTHKEAITVYVAKLVVLGIIASLFSFALTLLLLPAAGSVIKDLTPLEFSPSASIETLLSTLVLAIFYATFVCLPVILQIRRIKPSLLFSEELEAYRPISLKTMWALLPAALGFYWLAVTQANSLVVGSIFCGAFFAVALIFSLLGLFLIRASRSFHPKSLSIRLALRYIQRRQVEVMLSFLALGIGSTLIGIIPSIRHSIEQEIMAPKGQKNRSLFLFDIQAEQKKPLEDKLASYDLKALISPMIRARLAKINGKPFKKDVNQKSTNRESQESSRMRNRGVNLSYRESLASSETIVSGRQFKKRANGDNSPYEVTLEQRYARRIGIKVGDTLTFTIQSIPINAKVVGLRKVKWNSFDPNFFIQFQPGALDDAPKTYVAGLPALSPKERLFLQKELVDSFPNISIIDVTKLLKKILAIVNQMSWVLFLMAILSIIAGLVVLFSIASHQAHLRQKDINLLKVLGLSFQKITKTVLFEFLVITGAAAFIGSLASILMAVLIDNLIFAGGVHIDWLTPVLLFVSIVVISLLTAFLATKRTLIQKATLHLKS